MPEWLDESELSGLVRCSWVNRHNMCSWYTTDPSGLCEEHSTCDSCGEVPCHYGCLGPRRFGCDRCGQLFLQHQVSHIGAGYYCPTCRHRPIFDAS